MRHRTQGQQPGAGTMDLAEWTAAAHECITIMFCDVVGFTSMSKVGVWEVGWWFWGWCLAQP